MNMFNSYVKLPEGNRVCVSPMYNLSSELELKSEHVLQGVVLLSHMKLVNLIDGLRFTNFI